MTGNQIAFLNALENQRHDQVTEAQQHQMINKDKVQLEINKKDADTRAQQAYIASRELQLNERDLKRKEKDSQSQRALNKAYATTARRNATSQRIQARASISQARSAEKQADAALSNALANLSNAETNKMLAQIEGSRLTFDSWKGQKDISVKEYEAKLKKQQWKTNDKKVDAEVKKLGVDMLTGLITSIAKAKKDWSKGKLNDAQASKIVFDKWIAKQDLALKTLQTKYKKGELNVKQFNAAVGALDTISKIVTRRRESMIKVLNLGSTKMKGWLKLFK